MYAGVRSAPIHARRLRWKQVENGAPFACRLPWQPQEYTPKPARIELRAPGLAFKEPVLVNLLDGSVHSLPAPKNENGAVVFTNLPLFDFPLVIAESAEVAFVAKRTTPENDAIPRL